MKKIIISIALLIIVISINAQEAEDDIPMPGESSQVEDDTGTPVNNNLFEVSGYVENTVNSEYVYDQSTSLYNNTRIRLNIEGGDKKTYDYALGFVGTLYSGTTDIDLSNYLYQEQKESLVPGMEKMLTFSLKNEIVLQEAFISLYGTSYKFRIGRQKYYSGVGYAYNPIDFFNNKNPIDPSYEINGVDAALFIIYLPSEIEFENIAILGSEIENINYQAKIKLTLVDFDISLQYSYFMKKLTDFETINSPTVLNNIGSGLVEFDDYIVKYRNHFVGGSFIGDVWGLSIYSEGGGIWSRVKGDSLNANRDDFYVTYLSGFNYTFEMQLYIMAEYLYNGNGVNSNNNISLNDRLQYYSGENISIVKNTLFTGLSYPITDLSDIGLYSIIGIDDKSLIINPNLKISLITNVSMDMNLVIPYSKEESSLGNAGMGGFVRIKASF